MAHQLRMELFKDEASRDYVGTKPHLDQEDAACNTQAAFKPSQSTKHSPELPVRKHSPELPVRKHSPELPVRKHSPELPAGDCCF